MAHNCHGKTKNLTAKTKKQNTSRQNRKTSRLKQNTSRQNQKPHGKTKDLTAKPNTWEQKPKLFCFCCEVFGFAVRFLVLPWGILFFVITSYRGFLLNTKLWVPGVGFSVAGLDRAKLGVYQFQSFLFIVVIVIISILLKPTFWEISIYSQSLLKIL